MWALKIFLVEFGLTLFFSVLIYAIWRIGHPGQTW